MKSAEDSHYINEKKPMKAYKFFRLEDIENNKRYAVKESEYKVINADSYAEACEELVSQLKYHVVTEGDGDEN
jgi:hypothetical protein